MCCKFTTLLIIALCLLAMYNVALLVVIIMFGAKEINEHRFLHVDNFVETGQYVITSLSIHLYVSFIIMLILIVVILKSPFKRTALKIFLVILLLMFEGVSLFFGIAAFIQNCSYADGTSCYSFESPVYLLSLIHLHAAALIVIAVILYCLYACCCKKKN